MGGFYFVSIHLEALALFCPLRKLLIEFYPIMPYQFREWLQILRGRNWPIPLFLRWLWYCTLNGCIIAGNTCQDFCFFLFDLKTTITDDSRIVAINYSLAIFSLISEMKVCRHAFVEDH